VEYTSEFKRLVIYKLLSEPNKPIRQVADEVGVSKSTIWDWKREVCRVAGAMVDSSDEGGGVRRERSARTKLRLAMEADGLSEEELRAFLEREGLEEKELREWQDSMLWAVQSSSQRATERRQVRRLERQLRQKEKELKEAKALLELQKKVQEIWGDEGDDTPPESD
jgi:DNA-binding transcriptional MerR regulator